MGRAFGFLPIEVISHGSLAVWHGDDWASMLAREGSRRIVLRALSFRWDAGRFDKLHIVALDDRLSGKVVRPKARRHAKRTAGGDEDVDFASALQPPAQSCSYVSLPEPGAAHLFQLWKANCQITYTHLVCMARKYGVSVRIVTFS